MQKALLPVSFLTLLAAVWLALMEMVLRHPGFCCAHRRSTLHCRRQRGDVSVAHASR